MWYSEESGALSRPKIHPDLVIFPIDEATVKKAKKIGQEHEIRCLERGQLPGGGRLRPRDRPLLVPFEDGGEKNHRISKLSFWFRKIYTFWRFPAPDDPQVEEELAGDAQVDKDGPHGEADQHREVRNEEKGPEATNGGILSAATAVNDRRE